MSSTTFGNCSALYVDTLIVLSGSTLDLNSKKVYARIAKVDGTLLGGSISTLSGGGFIALESSAAGTIATPGQFEEWTFFGRANQAISVYVDPGSIGSPSPASPYLGRAQFELIDPNNNVIASAVSSTDGEEAAFLSIPLPLDGTYRIRVKAAPSLPNATGNYLVSLYSATYDQRQLVLNQQASGNIETIYSSDRWTFTGTANQSLAFKLVAATTPSLRFRLTGPNGWVGFTDLAGDSPVISLPETGLYTVEAATGGYGTGAYAFRLDDFSRVILTVGQTYSGTLPASGFSQVFEVSMTEASPLAVTLNVVEDGRVDVYARRGAPPTRQTFDYYSDAPGADHVLLIPTASPGPWYFLVYVHAITQSSPFSLTAQASPFLLTGVTPASYGTNQTATLTVSGAVFVPGTQVELIRTPDTIPASNVHVNSAGQLTATFNLAGVNQGVYDVRVVRPDATAATLPAAFTVTAAGQGVLETNLILPSALGRHELATLYVEYKNTGNAALEAPILTLQSADGTDRPLLTLDQSLIVQGFWTSATPSGFSNSAQIYASGAIPGLLLPGESVRVPVYYAGLEQPWDMSDNDIALELLVTSAGSTETIPWEIYKPILQPSWIANDTWDAVFANLATQVGSTWGDYIRMLSDNSAYLGRLGVNVTDVVDLYNFELQQAIGLRVAPTLASAVDASLPSPGLTLDFNRYFGGSLLDRSNIGAFGRGWTVPWQITLEEDPDGSVTIQDAASSLRLFQPDRRRAGTYLSAPSDSGVLQKIAGGAFTLTETSGLITRFNPDGSFAFLQDINGNRISATYNTGQLTNLAHSSGASLTITYNTDGLISTLADSAGRVTTYSYDPANLVLLSATGPGGTTTYTYDTGPSPATKYALTSVTDFSGVSHHFDYDTQGRLTSTFINAGIEPVSYAYDTAGTVTITDADGVGATFFFDHRGLILRQEDSLGSFTLSTYNNARQLINTTDSFGNSVSYIRCDCGRPTSITDQLGNTSTYSLGGPKNNPTVFTDANGNTTKYAYDANGNLSATTYADGSVESLIRDALGNPTTLVNRRGQAINFSYNAAGQIIRQELPDGTSNVLTYDSRNRLETATDTHGTTTFTYNNADLLTQVDYPQGRWVAYEYDLAGRRTRMEDSSGFVVQYRYDAAGRLVELKDGAGASIILYTYGLPQKFCNTAPEVQPLE